jgi:hypothetical protein
MIKNFYDVKHSATYLIFLYFVCIAILFNALGSEQTELAILAGNSSIMGNLYNCDDMVKTINYLRRCGKGPALEILKGLIEDDKKQAKPDNDNILLICRLLFVNPKGWEKPRLGYAFPSINTAAATNFPFFPLAISDGVPFLLVRGYGYQGAAQSLTQSEAFKQLYADKESLKSATDMIVNQSYLQTTDHPQIKSDIKIEIK